MFNYACISNARISIMSGIVVLLSGSGTNLQAILNAKHPYTGADKIDVKYVISDNPKAFGLERAQKKKIPTLSQPNIKLLEKSVTKLAKANKIDLIVLAGFMKLLSAGFVRRWESHIINIHPSLLPAFKGAGAIKQAYDYGCRITGVTIHYVDKGMDTGKIIAQQECRISKRDTLQTLEKKIHKIEHKLYPNVIKELLRK